MGLISSRFFEKPSTRATLEKIEQELQNIEERRWDKLKREQFTIQILSFLPVTILIINLCILAYPSDSSWRDKLILSIPIVILNLTLLVCRKMVQWYSRWSLDNEELRLRKLQKEKKRILEMVCETESYRVATELLEKYDPKQLRRRDRGFDRPTTPVQDRSLTKFTASPIKSPKDNSLQKQQSLTQLQHLNQARQQMSIAQSIPANLNQSLQVPAPPVPAPPPSTPIAKHISRSNLNTTVVGAAHNTSTYVAASSVQGRPVRPVLSKDRTFFEKMVDWVIADGPENRFALICRFCYGHNGMSLAEEYETINFRCCYCYNLNTTSNKRQVHDQLQPERERNETVAPSESITTPSETKDNKVKESGESSQEPRKRKKVPPKAHDNNVLEEKDDDGFVDSENKSEESKSNSNTNKDTVETPEVDGKEKSC